MKRVVIRGSEWLRNSGQAHYHALLLNNRGKKCCLGIAASACGIEDDIIINQDMPSDINDENTCFHPWVGGEKLSNNAMSVNDCVSSDEYKIQSLRPLFKEANMTIVWRPDL